MSSCATQCALRFANRRRAWYTWRHPSQRPNPLGRAGRNRRASPTQTREKRRNGAAWAPILMFARGRAGAKGDLWRSGILVCGHPVTGHPRASHLVHTLVHGPPSARKSSIRSMIRQFVLERPAQYFQNSDGWLCEMNPDGPRAAVDPAALSRPSRPSSAAAAPPPPPPPLRARCSRCAGAWFALWSGCFVLVFFSLFYFRFISA